MGCQCNKKTEEEEELNKEAEPNLKKESENKELETGDNLNNQKNIDINQENTNPKNEEQDEDYLEKLNEEKNAKYAEYPDKMLEIINKIRENPVAYADVIEDSIKYIIEVPDKEDETKSRLVFKKKVKVALNKG
jgi:hypothetical protein